jgi:glycosyltransferase involved in cell wall biosynthesis
MKKTSNKKNIKICEIWGTYPPPIGGVTIHLKRLYDTLKEKDPDRFMFKNFNGEYENKIKKIYRVKNKFSEFLKLTISKNKMYHLHTNNIFAFLLFTLFGFNKIYGVTLHNKTFEKKRTNIQDKIIKIFLKRANFIILNDSGYGKKIKKKFDLNTTKIFNLSAFIPPSCDEKEKIDIRIKNLRKSKKYLISANGYKIRYENGVDVYGLDLLIELIYNLKKKNYNIGLIYCLPQIGEKNHFKKIIKRIHELELIYDILIYNEWTMSAFEIWRLSDVFIRPTSTDMEGISVKEALYVGTTVIASDVCERPKEVILFESRNLSDLIKKTEIALNDKKYFEYRTTSPVDDIMSIYSNYFCNV